MSEHLNSFAKRLESDPDFLASALKTYAQSERLDDARLAQLLECTMETLTLIRICRAPRADRFREDINQVAHRFNLNRDALAQAARQGQVLLQMRRTAPSDHGLLLAARDDDEEQPESQP